MRPHLGLLLLAWLFLLCWQVPMARGCIIQPIKDAVAKVKKTVDKVKSKFQSAKDTITGGKPKYIGCYADRDDDRDIQFIGGRKSDMDISKCNDICIEKYPMTRFFGVQNGNLCFCGNDYGRFGVRRDGHCATPCAGDKDEVCGGELLNSVHEVKT